MTTIDYDTDNYTISELLAIVGLDDPNEQLIVDTTNTLIDRFQTEGASNLVSFFQDIQTKLLQYMNQLETGGGDAEYEPNSDQTDRWWR